VAEIGILWIVHEATGTGGIVRRARRSWVSDLRTTLPALTYQADPLGRSIRHLGRKWTLLLVRDMAFLHLSRFGEFIRNNPGLSPRVLSRRLREMQREGLVARTADRGEVRYRLTAQGEDAVMILLAFLQYGLRYSMAGVGLDPGASRRSAGSPG
jgi:DNA-binding HxlR family transcriptional regulator